MRDKYYCSLKLKRINAETNGIRRVWIKFIAHRARNDTKILIVRHGKLRARCYREIRRNSASLNNAYDITHNERRASI